MTEPQRFPIPNHEMWKNDLEVLPQVSNDVLERLESLSETPLSYQEKKAYFSSPVLTNACDSGRGIVHAQAGCFASRVMAGVPYKVFLAFELANGEIADASCDCSEGASGACRHIVGTAELISLLKQEGFKEAPSEISCTEILYARRREEEEQRQLDRAHKLGRGLLRLGDNNSFAATLLAAEGPFVETKMGLAPVGSPMSYHRCFRYDDDASTARKYNF